MLQSVACASIGMLLVSCSPLVAQDTPAEEVEMTSEAAKGIADVIRRMQIAIERADSGAYMLAVDTADPIFAEEQRKWARDLRSHPIESVRVRAMIGLGRRHVGDAWLVPFFMGWTLPDETDERTVASLAVFRPLGLPDGDWVYSGRLWEEHPGVNVRILTDPEDEMAAEMAKYLAGHVGTFRASIEQDLGETLSMDPTIKIYPEMESLQASIALSYTSPLGGWNEPGESIKLLSRPGFIGPRLDATVAHELGHAVSFEWGQSIIDAPWWSLEGIAEVVADPFRGERFARVKDAAVGLSQSDQLMPFDKLSDFRGEAMNFGRQVYVQGRSMVAYMTKRFGSERRNEWFREMGAGRSIEVATLRVFEMSFDELDRDWRASLRSE